MLARIFDLQSMTKNLGTFFRDRYFKQPGFRPRNHCAWWLIVKQQRNLHGLGAISANDRAAIGQMGAQDRMGIAMPKLEEAS
jgi:hypothetical protein